MFRRIISILTLMLLSTFFTGCATSKKKVYIEKKGLMLLETTQLGRNKGYYTKHKAKSLNRDYKSYKKKKSRHKKKTYGSN
jgi:hypothetical protein